MKNIFVLVVLFLVTFVVHSFVTKAHVGRVGGRSTTAMGLFDFMKPKKVMFIALTAIFYK